MILRSLRVILRSLRARIVAGALLWSFGLLVLVDVVSRIAANMFPALSRINLLLVSVTGTFSLIAGLLIVGSGLRKLDAVRTRVDALRAGEVGPSDWPVDALLDSIDADLERDIADLGMRTLVTDTVMGDDPGRARLARSILEFASSL